MPASLRFRFYLAVIGISVIPILILGLIAGNRTANELERQSLALQSEMASRVEREVTAFVEARLSELAIVERTNLLARMSDSQLTAIINRLLAQGRAYQSIQIVELAGRIRVSAIRTGVEWQSTQLGSHFSDMQSAFSAGRHSFVGPVEYDARLREPMLDVAVPIIDRRSGRAVSMLFARVRIKQIWTMLASLDLPFGTEAFVVNGAGRILAHRLASMVLSGTIFQAPKRNGRHLLDDGEPGLVAIRDLSIVDGSASIVVTRSMASALAVAVDTRNATLVSAIVLMAAAALLSLLLSRQIVEPIEKLAVSARRISSDDLNTSIDVSGPSEIVALGETLQHMTDRMKQTIAELGHAEYIERQRAMVTLESIGDAVITTDAHGQVTYLNPVAEHLTGWSLADAKGHPTHEVFNVVNEQTRNPAPDPVSRCLREGRIVGLANHSVLLSRNGNEYAVQDSAAPIREANGEVLGVVMVFSDVSNERRLQDEILHQASHDSLTGLVNRREFEYRLNRVLDTVRADSSEHALCYLDLDQFKIINDTCGHAAGDALLRQVAALFGQKVRRRDTLARIGGDEFAVLMEHCAMEQASRVAESLRSAAEDLRFAWEERVFSIGVSIGLVPITPDSNSVNALLGAADNACYAAKDAGRNRVHVYREDDSDLTKRRDEMRWVGILTQALEAGQFELYAQKIVDLSDDGGSHSGQETIHYELLLRLVGANNERILPEVFLPAAERYNVISAIDRWVIERTFGWLARREMDAPPVLCSINISGTSIGDDGFLGYVLERLEESGIAGEQVCFEITETSAIGNLMMATQFIQTLRRHGCSFALDDFGRGLSSFAYLKTLPVQYLKIDGLFVKDIAQDPMDLAMVRCINDVGQLLGMRTIAEFVETEEVFDELVTLGVDAVQGFKFGQPEPLIVLGS